MKFLSIISMFFICLGLTAQESFSNGGPWQDTQDYQYWKTEIIESSEKPTWKNLWKMFEKKEIRPNDHVELPLWFKRGLDVYSEEPFVRDNYHGSFSKLKDRIVSFSEIEKSLWEDVRPYIQERCSSYNTWGRKSEFQACVQDYTTVMTTPVKKRAEIIFREGEFRPSKD